MNKPLKCKVLVTFRVSTIHTMLLMFLCISKKSSYIIETNISTYTHGENQDFLCFPNLKFYCIYDFVRAHNYMS